MIGIYNFISILRKLLQMSKIAVQCFEIFGEANAPNPPPGCAPQ